MSCLSFASERARLGGVICSEKWRVNRFDYHAGTLSNYGSAFQVKVTAYLDEFGGAAEIPVFQDCAVLNRHLIGAVVICA
jgi:hypothetical protein